MPSILPILHTMGTTIIGPDFLENFLRSPEAVFALLGVKRIPVDRWSFPYGLIILTR